MAAASLRQLGLSSLKRVYKLDRSELVAALRGAANRRLDDRALWDALLYRATLLRAELRPVDLALTLDAMAKVRHRDASFMEYYLQEVRTKARRFLVADAALLLNAFAKLAVRDELLGRSLLPSLLRRVTERTRWEDLALLALSYARLGGPGRAPIFDRIVSALTPRLHTLGDGHALSLLACAFVRRPSTARSVGPLFDSELGDAAGDGDDLGPPLGDVEAGERGAEGEEDGDGELGCERIPHLSFVEMLLAQCDKNLWAFRSADILHLCLALSLLAHAGHRGIFPPRLLKRMEKRMASLYFEFSPAQFVRCLEMLRHLPELEEQCAGQLLDEIAYRARDVTPPSCLSLLRTVRRLGGHPRAHSAAAWRLTREDAAKAFSPAEVAEIAEIFTSLAPQLWESREALLCLLHGLARRRLQPEPPVLARLLRSCGMLGVRDTTWFHLCDKICIYDLSTPNSPRQPRPLDLDEAAAADAVLALAKMNLPQLLDATELFSRAGAQASSLASASALLEAVALVELVGRRPGDLTSMRLGPLVALAAGRARPRGRGRVGRGAAGVDEDGCGRGASDRSAGGSCGSNAGAPLRLFPFTEAAANACEPELLASWRRTAAAGAVPERRDDFAHAVGCELSTWVGVGLASSVVAGPLCVPWALSLTSLAAHLRENPLEGAFVPSQRRRDLPPAAEPDTRGAEADGVPRPETHVLLLPLREPDFYHASATIRGQRQRAKTRVLGAQKYAEISLLRRLGWYVCCVAEHDWTWNAEDPISSSLANKELIFRLVAGLGGSQDARDARA